MNPPLLQVEGLTVSFVNGRRSVRALDDVGFTLDRGRTLGMVGESGCGKSLTALSIMRLLPSPPARMDGGRIVLTTGGAGRDLAALPQSGRAIRAVGGAQIGMIFQEPMTALDPAYTIGEQIREGLVAHRRVSTQAANRRALELLTMVGVPAPEQRLRQYPHELSGGLRQRATIAIALACDPALLIADEPTTGLDVTIQTQVLALMRDMQARLGMAILFITHDMGVIAEMADDVIVMYLGRIVEYGPVRLVLEQPAHPYTRGLIASIPTLGTPRGHRLEPIQGVVPSAAAMPAGCRFNDRCPYAQAICREQEPPVQTLVGGQHAACWFAGALP
jgi:oligopeptide/dipeptide ABC transporter ATP-binding protein